MLVAKVGRGNSGHTSGLRSVLLVYSGDMKTPTLPTSTLLYRVLTTQRLSRGALWYSGYGKTKRSTLKKGVWGNSGHHLLPGPGSCLM